MQCLPNLWRRSALALAGRVNRTFGQCVLPVQPRLGGPLNVFKRRVHSDIHRHTMPHSLDATLPTATVDAERKLGNFDLVKRVKLDFTDVVISKWRSRITGLSVVHLDYEGAYLRQTSPMHLISYA